jgi:hypothetical protein
MRLIKGELTEKGLTEALPEICGSIKFAATGDPPDGRKDGLFGGRFIGCEWVSPGPCGTI